MTHRFLTAALLSTALLGANSFAANAMPQSREQVRAAYLQAKSDGSLLRAGEASTPALRLLPNARSRSEVRDELLLARQSGALTRAGEAGILFAVATPAIAPRERQQVRAEAVVFAHQSHAMNMMD